MARYIVKLNNYYFEYSTFVDAPVTWGMLLEEFKSYYQQEYGNEGIRDLSSRLQRVEQKGTSAYDEESAETTLSCNRAGPDESELTVNEIYRGYCLKEPVRGYIATQKGWEKL